MKRLVSLALVLFVSAFFLSPTSPLNAQSLASKLSGQILLQVERNGEAWYVNPASERRHYMGRPDDAFALMRELGVGIATANLRKIPVADANFSGLDADGDGFSDMAEDAFGTDKYDADSDSDGYGDKTEVLAGYDPLAVAKLLPVDSAFASAQKGKILLQVEDNGEAWYVNPGDGKRYFLGRPADAFSVMRSLGLGITDANLALVPQSSGTQTPSADPVVLPPRDGDLDQSEIDELEDLIGDLDTLLDDQADDDDGLDDSGVEV